MSCSKGSAPFDKRYRSTLIVPVSDDMCKGDLPSDMVKLMSAPDLISILLHLSPLKSSILDAICKAVSPIGPPEICEIEKSDKLYHASLSIIFNLVPYTFHKWSLIPRMWTLAPSPSNVSTTSCWPDSTAKWRAV